MSTPNPRDLRLSTRRDQEPSPFHPGEQRVQLRVGVRDPIERAGRNMIKKQMPDQFRDLFEQLPLLIVGSMDAEGRVWASMLAGPPGFIHSPNPTTLEIHAQPAAGDPLAHQLASGSAMGLLGIQLETRRRNRANGHINATSAGSFTVDIEQTFGNCKQYIQAREPRFDPSLVGTALPPATESARLSARASEFLARTDTFFLATASAHAERHQVAEGIDVSHRGGRPGFVRVEHDAQATHLTVPDFRGNFMFNSFGNLEVNPHAGIVCADFSSGDLLSITGSARVIWDGPELDAFEGAERLLSFTVESGVLLRRALPLRFQGLVPSPDLLETGTWA